MVKAHHLGQKHWVYSQFGDASNSLLLNVVKSFCLMLTLVHQWNQQIKHQLGFVDSKFHLSIYLYTSSLYIIYIYIHHISICIYIYIYISIYISIYLSIYLSIYIYLFIYIYINMRCLTHRFGVSIPRWPRQFGLPRPASRPRVQPRGRRSGRGRKCRGHGRHGAWGRRHPGSMEFWVIPSPY